MLQPGPGDHDIGPAQRRQVGLLEARQAEGGAALVRLVDGGDMLGRQLQRRGNRPVRLIAADGSPVTR